MSVRPRILAGLLAGALLLSACGGTDDTATGGASETTPADDGVMSEDEMSEDDAAGEHDGPADDEMSEEDAAGAQVRTATATAPDGSTFTIDDFAGGQVFVETFATWCSTCRAQLGSTQEAAVAAGDDAVFLVLSVETSIDAANLATYADENGFDDLQFGLLDPEGLAAFEAQFGRSVLNPPSTPKFRVAADGSLSELTTGMESAEEILSGLGSA